MHVLAFCARKGGVGKTTLSAHVAVQAERSGHGPVALIDTDPLGPLAAWWHARRAESPALAATSLADLPADLRGLRAEGCRLAVIDTPPAITAAIQRVIQAADLVAIPTRPSPHDLRAVAGTVELAERANRATAFVLNGAAARARITSDAAAALSRRGALAPAFVHHRTAYAAAMVDGRTVMELDGQHAASREIAALWAYLEAQLERVGSPRVFARPNVQGFGRRTGT